MSETISSRMKKLVHLCRELQRLNGENPFFLSVRDAARTLELSGKSLRLASAFLRGLCRDGVIEPVAGAKAGGRRATRYRHMVNSG